MRKLLILGGVGFLTAAAWTVAAAAHGSGHGGSHGSPGHVGSEGHMRHEGSHAEHAGMGLLTAYLLGQLEPGHAAPEVLTGGPMIGGPEHVAASHPASTDIHPLEQVPLRVERGESVILQQVAPGAAGSDREGAATAQPDPTVSPWSPRPPGAAGPGRPVSGGSGPGRPGPGRPARP